MKLVNARALALACRPAGKRGVEGKPRSFRPGFSPAYVRPKIRFVPDSPLEEDGFELPVPRMRGDPRRRAVAGFQLGAAQLLEGLWAYASSRRPRQSELERRPRT